eukprot:PhM_4_TR7886/c0_g1_i1/m.55492
MRPRTLICLVFFVACCIHIPLWLTLTNNNNIARTNNKSSQLQQQQQPGGGGDDIAGVDDPDIDDISGQGGSFGPPQGGDDDLAEPGDSEDEGAGEDDPLVDDDDSSVYGDNAPTRAPAVRASLGGGGTPAPTATGGGFQPLALVEITLKEHQEKNKALSGSTQVTVSVYAPRRFPSASLAEMRPRFNSRRTRYEVVVLYGGAVSAVAKTQLFDACAGFQSENVRCRVFSVQRNGVAVYDMNVAEAYFEAMRSAFGAYMLFLYGDMIPEGDMPHELLTAYRAADNIGMVGCLVSTNLTADTEEGSVNNPPLVVSHGVMIAEGRADTAVMFDRMAGFSTRDARVRRAVAVHALPWQCILMPRTLYFGLKRDLAVATDPETNGLPTHLPVGIEGLYDIMFAVRKLGKRVVVAKSRGNLPELLSWSPTTGYGGMGVEATQFNRAFQTKWGEFLLQHLAPADDVSVVWDTFCIKCFGFTNEVMHFVQPLEGIVPVRSKQDYDCFCPGTPVSFTSSLRRLAQVKGFEKRFNLKKSSPREVLVWVAHKDPGSFPASSFEGLYRRPDYVVGRAMYEFTKTPKEWLKHQNDVDEIWVPSRFVYYVFKSNGFDEKKLVLMPEPIDVHFFDPRVTQPVLLPNRDLWNSYSNFPSSETFDADKPPYSLRRHFKFMSVFKWEDRKAWDVMLRAYVKEFAPSKGDRVSLYLYCYLWSGGDARNPKAILEKGLEHLRKNVANFDDADAPHIEIVTEQLSEEDMVAAYGSADAFVLPTRGEGWGLPVIQAMSMALPTIATNWSGNVDFMRDDITYPLKLDKLENVPKDSSYGWMEGKVWAQPSEEHLRTLMRKIYSDQAEAKERGRRAREHVIQYYSDEVIARVVRQRLLEIRDVVHGKRDAEMRNQSSSGGSSSSSSTSSDGKQRHAGHEDHHGLFLSL